MCFFLGLSFSFSCYFLIFPFSVLDLIGVSVLNREERFLDDVEEMRDFVKVFREFFEMFGSEVPNIPNGCGPGCKGGHVHVPPGKCRIGIGAVFVCIILSVLFSRSLCSKCSENVITFV